MDLEDKPVRVLYSFALKLGGGRINTTAWEQVKGIAAAGASVLVFSGVAPGRLPQGVTVRPTLARGKLRISYKLVGRLRAYAWHDYVVSRRLERMTGQIDVIHCWPIGSRRTLETAARLGIPTVYERPNAHTAFAYDAVQQECRRLGVSMPEQHEHAYNRSILRIENEEYRRADRLLCPSDFVAKTFLDRGFSPNNLARHHYGFDENIYYPAEGERDASKSLTMLFVGGCAPRKGLHFALEAWRNSSASKHGTFTVVGGFVPGYAEKLSDLLRDPSVRVLGHRTDVPALMRASDVLILPSIEEGSALVTYEARGSGCVLLVSDASGAVCKDMENALVHRVGDIATLTEHITLLDQNRPLLKKLRAASLSTVKEISWTAAGATLFEVYRKLISETSKSARNMS